MTTPAAETAPQKASNKETAKAAKAPAVSEVGGDAPVGSINNPAPLRAGSNRETLDAIAKEYREGQK